MSRRVFLYMDDVPRKTGSGAHLRFYSNVQAWLDLGYQAEIVHVCGPESPAVPLPPEWPGVTLTRIEAGPEAQDRGLPARLLYRAGWPLAPALRYYFYKHAAVLQAARQRHRQDPAALHQFEGDSMANVIADAGLGKLAIWSHHDIASAAIASMIRIRCEQEKRSLSRAEQREIHFLRRYEQRVSARCPLVLCISEEDSDQLRAQGWQNAELLPMSIPDEEQVWQPHPPMLAVTEHAPLRLLHLGKLGHLSSYRSLEFLLSRVLPLLSNGERDLIRLSVVGGYETEEPRAAHILSLAKHFPRTVELLGFVPDLDPLYRDCHLQVVTSTDASGLRTRIVESFARGLPVLSTVQAAKGVAGLEPGSNILLADDAAGVAALLRKVLADPARLGAVAAKARETYMAFHSRAVVARTLEGLLARLA